jgi:hypothetical protein
MKLLEPCSICDADWNHEDDLIDTLYPSKRDIKTGEFTEWNVVCQLHNGGCGRTVYGESKDAVISRWNRGLTDEIMEW